MRFYFLVRLQFGNLRVHAKSIRARKLPFALMEIPDQVNLGDLGGGGGTCSQAGALGDEQEAQALCSGSVFAPFARCVVRV